MKFSEAIWIHRVRRCAKDISSVIPANHIFILVDEGTFDLETFARWRTLPFLERDGQHWGCPKDDEVAIRELERLRQSGADFIIFVWQTFWWLDHYTKLHQYLRAKFHCVLENDRLVVFDLRL
jgi:hypothetical protein